MELLSPFPVAGYYGSQYFCDREEETEKIIDALLGNRNITLFALRRIGKTGLIHHVFYNLSKKKYITIYLDLLSSQNLNDFINLLSTAIMQAVPEKSTFGKEFIKFVKLLRPVITYDQVTGTPQIALDISKSQEKESTLKSLMDFLNKREEKIVIALDEFQQILNYPEKNTEALLRGEIQMLKNTNFIFSGSQQHMLISMFTEAKKPFFASTQLMKLKKLDPVVYKKFIRGNFRKIDSVGEEDINKILDWTKCHTYYTQFVCNRFYLLRKNQKDNQVEELFYEILKEYEPINIHYRELLTSAQWQLLIAIAKEDRLFHPQGKEFIQKYKLGIPASVKRALDALLQKEMIYKETNEEGNIYYEVYDVFLSRWLEKL
jgi:uncharacterized protein